MTVIYHDFQRRNRPTIKNSFDELVPWLAARTAERIAAGEDERTLIGVLDLDDVTASIATRDEARELEEVSGVISRALDAPGDRGWLQCVALIEGNIMSMKLCLTPASGGGAA